MRNNKRRHQNATLALSEIRQQVPEDPENTQVCGSVRQQNCAIHGAVVLLVMADCVGFQAQIASVIELLANSAVAEICKLVDDGYAVLRSQMDLERQKSEKENRVLRQKLREMDVKMRSYERKMKRRNLREEMMHDAHFRPPKGKRVELTGVQTSRFRISDSRIPI